MDLPSETFLLLVACLGLSLVPSPAEVIQQKEGFRADGNSHASSSSILAINIDLFSSLL